MEYIKSLEFWTEYKTRLGIVKIKKFSIEDFLQFNLVFANYQNIQLKIIDYSQLRWKNRRAIQQRKRELKSSINGLIDIAIFDTDIKLTQKNKIEIINLAVEYNDLFKSDIKNKKKDKEDTNDFWLQDLIVTFGRELGYNKSEVMGLYMCELPILLKRIDIHKKMDLNIDYVLKAVASNPSKENQKLIAELLKIPELQQKVKVILARDNPKTSNFLDANRGYKPNGK